MCSPGEGGHGEEAEQELQAVEAEQDAAEDELQPQDEGLQQQVVNGQCRAREQDEDGHARGQRALAQVPLPAWSDTPHTVTQLFTATMFTRAEASTHRLSHSFIRSFAAHCTSLSVPLTIKYPEGLQTEEDHQQRHIQDQASVLTTETSSSRTRLKRN
ncbi:hypothetical protein INR49_010761 [Caranx melampygus]|nr:hypothetical protein INR49_010761 [Caranx melampygus]